MRVQIALGLVAALVFAPVVVAKGNAHHWETSPHHLSALVGTTYTKECGNAFTIGVDYEYRVSDFLGVGFVAEYAFEDLDAYTYLLVADLHITNNFIAQKIILPFPFFRKEKECVFYTLQRYEKWTFI